MIVWVVAVSVGFVLGVLGRSLCEVYAQRAERIYKARHRDHARVPSMREAVERENSRRAWLADDDGPVFHLDASSMQLSSRAGWGPE